MTDEEALTLRKGDLVTERLGDEKFTSVVTQDVYASKYDGGIRIWVRRAGHNASGDLHSIAHAPPSHVEILMRQDPLEVNIYADFLEEKGYEEAAAVLRKAFPVHKVT